MHRAAPAGGVAGRYNSARSLRRGPTQPLRMSRSPHRDGCAPEPAGPAAATRSAAPPHVQTAGPGPDPAPGRARPFCLVRLRVVVLSYWQAAALRVGRRWLQAPRTGAASGPAAAAAAAVPVTPAFGIGVFKSSHESTKPVRARLGDGSLSPMYVITRSFGQNFLGKFCS